MANVKVTLGNTGYKAKPSGFEVGLVQNELKSLGTTEISPLELLYAVGKDGRSFKPAIYTDNSDLKAEDFIETQIIGIDIDAKKDLSWYTIEDSIKTLAKYELDYLGIYKSFSYTEETQCHRILFELPLAVCNDNMFYFINMLFNELFPADEACFDKARLFFGGKGVIEGTGKQLNLGNLFYAVIEKIKAESSNPNRYIETLCTKANLNMINGLPEVEIVTIEEYMQNVYSYRTLYSNYIGYVVGIPKVLIIPKFTTDITIQSTKRGKAVKTKVKKGNKPDKIKYNYGTERFPLDKLQDTCPLYEAVINGYWADHEELKILVWNFHPIEGAMDSIVNALLPYERKELNLNYRSKVYNLVASALHGEYEPKKCSTDCPYYKECKVISSGYSAPYHFIQANRVNNINKIPAEWRIKALSTTNNGDLPDTETEDILVRKPLINIEEDAHMRFDNCMKALKEGNHKELVVLKAPTGIGKTRMLIETDWSQFAGKRVAIAFPTHALKDEVAKEFKLRGIDVGIKPDKGKAVIKDAVLRERVDRLYEAGNIHASMEYHSYLYAHKDVPEYAEYLEQQAHFDSAELLLTTHADVLMNKTDRYDYLISDEDILLSSCETNSFRTSDIESALMYLQHQLDFDSRLVQSILNFIADPNEYSLMINKYNDYNVLFSKYQQEIEKIMNEQPTLNVNALKIITADYAMKSVNVLGETYIHFGKRRKLPQIPVMIMSATVYKAVYQITYRYERDCKFFDIDYVSDGGTLEQDLTFSFSRNNLVNNTERNINYLKESLKARGKNAEDCTVITFKSSKELFRKAGFTVAEDVHFGNTCGYNSYSGQNLIIAGTPHISSTDIKLYSLLLFDVVLSDDEFRNSEIETQQNFDINGIRLCFPSFTNPYIRLTQFYLIQSELTQAVGRSRLIRNKEAEVFLFSNFPLEETDNYYCDKQLLFQ